MLFAAVVSAQERFGIAHSNFGGADAAYLNPARYAGQWPYADIRVMGVDAFAWNSLVSWSDRQRPLLGEVRDGIAGNSTGNVVRRGSIYAGSHRGVVRSTVLGPAFSLALGRGTIAAGVRSRVHTSVSGVTEELANIIFEGIGYAPQFGKRYQLGGLRVLGAAWTETSLSYAHIIHAQGFGMLSAGASLKYNIGHTAGAVPDRRPRLHRMDTAQARDHNVSAGYGIAAPFGSGGSGRISAWSTSAPWTSATATARIKARRGAHTMPLPGRSSRSSTSVTHTLQKRRGRQHRFRLALHRRPRRVAHPSVEDLDSLLATSTRWTNDARFSIGLTALAIPARPTHSGQHLRQRGAIAVSGKRHMRLRHSRHLITFRCAALSSPCRRLPRYDVARPSIGAMLALQRSCHRLGPHHALRGPWRYYYLLDFYAPPTHHALPQPRLQKPTPSTQRQRGHDTCATPND
ncbi:MAG: DUF5723 family protein [Flavobacteriales bacterium]